MIIIRMEDNISVIIWLDKNVPLNRVETKMDFLNFGEKRELREILLHENPKFLRKYWYSTHLCENVNENIMFRKHFREHLKLL
jgi:hypothetical protein